MPTENQHMLEMLGLLHDDMTGLPQEARDALAAAQAGYDALAERQSEQVVDSIRFVTGVVPAVAFVVGLVAFSRFSLNEAEHRRLRAELEARSDRRE